VTTRRLSVWLAALVLLLAGTGCQAVLRTEADLHADGSGVVRAGLGLDADALAQLGDPAKELRLDDLRQAGWSVSGPDKEKDGLTWVRLSKGFATPDQGSEVAAQLSGPDGPFKAFRFTHGRSFLKTKTSFSGVVDLSNGLAGLSDPALQQALGNFSPGLDLAGLRQRFGADLDKDVQVQVVARLPGRSRTWQPKLGDKLELQLASEAWNTGPIAGALAALLFAATALVVAVTTRWRPARR
jgi:hypothetical protein